MAQNPTQSILISTIPREEGQHRCHKNEPFSKERVLIYLRQSKQYRYNYVYINGHVKISKHIFVVCHTLRKVTRTLSIHHAQGANYFYLYWVHARSMCVEFTRRCGEG